MATADQYAAQARAGRGSQVGIWGGRKKRFKGKSRFQFRLHAERPWMTNFNSLRLVKDLGNTAAVLLYQAIAEGKDPATGAPRAAPKHRPGGTRMVDTGELLKFMTRSKISGKSAAKSKCVIRSKRNRRGAVNAEAGRGNFLFRLDGIVESQMGVTLDGFVLAGLGTEGLPPQVGDLSQRRAWQLLGESAPKRKRRRRSLRPRPEPKGVYGV